MLLLVNRALLAEELAGPQRSSITARRRAAAFPTGKTFDAWDHAVSSVPAPTQRALRTLEWVARREYVVVCGPSGTGKSHFLEALGHAAIDPAPTSAVLPRDPRGSSAATAPDDSTAHAIKKIMRAGCRSPSVC